MSHPEIKQEQQQQQQQHLINHTSPIRISLTHKTTTLFNALPSDECPQIKLICWKLDQQPYLIPIIRDFLEKELAGVAPASEIATEQPTTPPPPTATAPPTNQPTPTAPLTTIWAYLDQRFPSRKAN